MDTCVHLPPLPPMYRQRRISDYEIILDMIEHKTGKHVQEDPLNGVFVKLGSVSSPELYWKKDESTLVMRHYADGSCQTLLYEVEINASALD